MTERSTAELVTHLRERARHWKGPGAWREHYFDAADRLEELQAEVDALRTRTIAETI